MQSQGPVDGGDRFDASVVLLKGLADPTRLRILWALTSRERSVGQLAEVVAAHVAAVSQHLARLREAGLVASRRDGTRIFYRLADEHVSALLEEVAVVTGRLNSEVGDGATSPQPVREPAPAPQRDWVSARSRPRLAGQQ